jgi:uncharacterized membrane protein YdjX (TVP38/TMEM64 family)
MHARGPDTGSPPGRVKRHATANRPAYLTLTWTIPGPHTGATLEPTTQSSRRHLTKRRLALAAVLAVLGGALVVVILKTGLMDTLNAVILRLREAGPAVFFVAMALLPAAGFPLLAFTLAAGPVFGPTLGTGWVIVWSLAAVIVNLLLTYWLADRAFRPLVSRLLAYFDFHLPDNLAGSAWQLSLIVRLTPGPPFWVQSYLLGLVRVPLVPYLTVSTGVVAGYLVALIWGGEAIVSGNGRLAFAAIGVLAVSVAGLQLLRKRAVRKQGPPAIPLAK